MRVDEDICLDIARREFRDGKAASNRYKHWSFIWQRNRLVEWATNRPGDCVETRKFGYRTKRHFVHAELAALRLAMGLLDRRRPWALVNIRLLADGNTAISKPCRVCWPLMLSLGCCFCSYSVDNDEFERLSIR